MWDILVICCMFNVATICISLILLGHTLKLYTEYFKDRSQIARRPNPTDKE